MSTRCQIGVTCNEIEGTYGPDDCEVYLYRHSDGYPSSVVPDILPWLKWFNENRGIYDKDYCIARLCAYLVRLYDSYYKPVEGFGGTIGYGIDTVIHQDIEYFYLITKLNLHVYEVNYDYKSNKLNYTLLENHDLRSNSELAYR